MLFSPFILHFSFPLFPLLFPYYLYFIYILDYDNLNLKNNLKRGGVVVSAPSRPQIEDLNKLGSSLSINPAQKSFSWAEGTEIHCWKIW